MILLIETEPTTQFKSNKALETRDGGAAVPHGRSYRVDHVMLQGVLDAAGGGGGAGLCCPKRRASDNIGMAHRPKWDIFNSTALKMVRKAH